MFVWQSTTTLGSTNWGSIEDLQVFANSNNSFSFGLGAKDQGIGGSTFTALSADVNFLGQAGASALVPFTLNFGPFAGPFLMQSANTFPNGETMAIQKLANGHWVIASMLADTSSVHPDQFNLYLTEFDASRNVLSATNFGVSGVTHGYFDLSVYANGYYQLAFGTDYSGTSDGLPFRVYRTDHQVATSTSSGGLPSNQHSIASGGYELGQTETGTMNANGQSRVFWIENFGTTATALKSVFVDASGNLLSSVETIWSRPQSNVFLGASSLKVAANNSTNFVVWSTVADPASGAASELILAICPNTLANTTINLSNLSGFSTTSNTVYDVTVMNNGNIALLSKSGFDFHVSILTAAGALVDDYTFQAIESANTMWLTTASSMSLVELTDGRLVVAGQTLTSLNLANYTSAQAYAEGDVSYMILDPRGSDIFGTSGDDNITGRVNQTETIYAGAGNDTVYTMSGGGTVYGDTGIDSIEGGTGSDIIFGGDDKDFIYGNDNNDEIYGGEGNDEINGGAGIDIIEGNAGFDFVDGGGDSDYIYGGSEKDVLRGGAGTDFIHGGTGSDELYGQADIDLLYGDAGSDIMDGGTEQDTVSYVESTAGIIFDMNNTTNNTGDANGDIYISIERFRLTDFDDTFYAGNNASFIDVNGGGGNDQIWGRTTGLSMQGGDGEDIFIPLGGGNFFQGDETNGVQYKDIIALFNSNRSVTVDMAAATTRNTSFTFLFGGQTQTAMGDVDGVSGSFFGDIISGNAFDNLLGGGLGDDQLFGRGGKDYLEGNEGSDMLFGDTENDQLFGNENNDTLEGGAGQDELDGGSNDAGGDTLSYTASTAGVSINLAISSAIGGDATGDVFINFENITGSAFGDQLIGDNGANVLSGGAGNDLFVGGLGNDTMIGGADLDVVDYASFGSGVAVNLTTGTGPGGDVISQIENITGSAFGDVLDGDNNANTMRGGAGNDFLVAGNGADLLIGGADNDEVSYETATTGVLVNLSTGTGANGGVLQEIENIRGSNFGDVLQGDNGANTIRGLDGNDFIIAGNGADLLIGGADNDTVSYETATAGIFANLTTGIGANGGVLQEIENLTGSNFGDVLIGSALGNTLKGGGGNDYLVGNAGSDALYGGADNDTFRFETTTFGNDVITDFQDNGDKLSFAAAVATNFNQFTILNNNTTNVTVQIAGQSIVVQGVANISLTAVDFLFV